MDSLLKEINMPKLEIIEDYVFYQTEFGNKRLVLPKNVKVIGKCAFRLTNLEELFLPDSIEYVCPSILKEKNLTIYVTQNASKKLDEEFLKNKNVKIVTLDDLLTSFTFKEINDAKLNNTFPFIR